MPGPLTGRASRTAVLFALASLAASALLVAPAAAQAPTTSVTLLWTAPGDDGMTGRASRYDLRISTNAISGTDTLSWWNAATVVDMAGRVPAPAGAADSVLVSSLVVGSRYYAVLRAADEVLNWSGYSNVAVIDLVDAMLPSRISDLRVRP
ncbi:MAG TPA: hypothetical protein VID50_02675 [Candidatus Eisenbacteria bacterium]|jgi:hypothetical protein